MVGSLIASATALLALTAGAGAWVGSRVMERLETFLVTGEGGQHALHAANYAVACLMATLTLRGLHAQAKREM